MSAWSCPQPGEILCTDDAVRMPVGSVLERLDDDNGKRYQVLSTPAELTRLTAVAEAARALHAELQVVMGSDEDPVWDALGVALEALDGERC